MVMNVEKPNLNLGTRIPPNPICMWFSTDDHPINWFQISLDAMKHVAPAFCFLRIAAEAARFAKSNLTLEASLFYLYQLLLLAPQMLPKPAQNVKQVAGTKPLSTEMGMDQYQV